VPALSLLLLAQAGFFERTDVDFWGRKRAEPPPAALWADSSAPAPVKRLLEEPTAEHARAYLAWQKRRLETLRAAMAAVEAEAALPPAPPPASASAGGVLYFSRPGCPWCARQERELEGLPVTRVPEGSPLWSEHGVTAVPTLVVRGRAFRGLTARSALLKELSGD
jgi:hypothetical protein